MREEILSNLKKILAVNNVDGFLSYMPYNRRYLSGFTGSFGYVIVTKEKNIFCTDFRYEERASDQCSGFDIEIVNPDRTVYDVINELQLRKLYIEDEFVTLADKKKLDENCSLVQFTDGSSIIKEMRAVKTVEELEMIEKSCAITCRVFNELTNHIKTGVSEKDLVEDVRHLMREYGADEPMFITVLAGRNTSMPHGLPSDYKIEKGDFVTVDIGSLYKGYGSDLTRTVTVGKANIEQRIIYETVLQAQLKVFDFIKPGVTGRELDKVARNYIEEKGYGQYFGHGLGHGVGLQLADLPKLTFSDEGNNIVRVNMVMTNEPGIYIKGFGGVRIEDTVQVTDTGYKILTPINKKLIEL